MRMVTERAGVNLGAIHYHFGSKRSLFGTVISRRLNLLIEERDRLFGIVKTEAMGGQPELERIVEAYLRPSFELAADGPAGAAWIKLVARYRLEPGPEWKSSIELQGHSLRRFRDALMTALPNLPPTELAYRLFFTLGATANTLMEAGTSGLLEIHESLGADEDDNEGVLVRLIDFVSAGLKSPYSGISETQRKEP
jgi:AcrR family transcriptional regulator